MGFDTLVAAIHLVAAICLVRLCTPKPNSKQKLFISDLPPGLILEVFSYLSRSRKRVWSSAANGCKTTTPTNSKPHTFDIPTSLKQSKCTPARTDLLVRLESKEWLLCDTCFTLHPRYEFEKYSRQKGTNPQKCKWPGAIQLCYCK